MKHGRSLSILIILLAIALAVQAAIYLRPGTRGPRPAESAQPPAPPAALPADGGYPQRRTGGPAEPRGEAAGMPPTNTYFIPVEIIDLWEIHPDWLRIEHRGAMRRAMEGDFGFAPRSIEAGAGFEPTELRAGGEALLVKGEFKDLDTRFGRRRLFFPVLKPAGSPRKGDLVPYVVTYRTPGMGHLHVNGRERRLLSIKQERLPAEPPATMLIAIPAESRILGLTDAQPLAVLRPPGWNVYVYRLCVNQPIEMIHIDFEVRGGSSPLPPYEDLSRMVPQNIKELLRFKKS